MKVKKPKLYTHKKTGAKSFTFNESGRAKGYDRDWELYRWRFLHHNPSCYICGRKAGVVDHILAHKGDMNIFKNLKNHMPVCTEDHNFLTGKFDRKSPPDTDGKIKWIAKRRDELNVKIKIKVLTVYGRNKK